MNKLERQRPLLLLLLGGRIHPAAMAVQHFQPAVVGCVVSIDTPERAESLRALVERSVSDCTVLQPEAVAPYEPGATRAAIERLAGQALDRPVVLSLTGGSVPMVLGGYEMARGNGWPAYYQDTGSGQLVDLAAEHEVTRIAPRLSIIDYLTICDARLNQSKAHPIGVPPEGLFLNAIALLTRDPAVTAEMMGWLFSGKKSSTIRLRNLHWPWGMTHRSLLNELADLELIEELTWRSGDRVQFRLRDTESLQFLNGRWLEQYVNLEAAAAAVEGAPVFDYCAHAVHFLSGGAPRELDFMGVRRGRLMAGSCKTSKNPWDKGALDELVAVTKNLGDNYSIRLFMTNQMRPESGHRLAASYGEFAEQARKARTVVITGDDLPGLRNVLAKEALHPTYASN